MRLLLIAPLAVLPVAYGATLALHPGVDWEPTPLANAKATMVAPGNWNTDPAHTSIGFTVRHLGLAEIQGRFEKTSGMIVGDPKTVAGSKVSFEIETSSINTAVGARDDHLRTPDFFDAATYPTIKFESSRIFKKGENFVAEGDLTIKDVTRKIQIPFRAYGPITDPWGNQRIGMVAFPFTINRKHFNVNYDDKLPDGTPAVGDDVTIRISLEATLATPKE